MKAINGREGTIGLAVLLEELPHPFPVSGHVGRATTIEARRGIRSLDRIVHVMIDLGRRHGIATRLILTVWFVEDQPAESLIAFRKRSHCRDIQGVPGLESLPATPQRR